MDIPIYNIALLVTQKCNLGCVYCYGGDGSYGQQGYMTEDTAIRSIDWLINQSKDVRLLSVCFFGGEPLLRFSLIKKVVEHAKVKGKEHNKDFRFSITTNATLLEEKEIEFFEEHNVNILVSFDGTQKLQDSQRPFKSGKGSYAITIPKIKRLLDVRPHTSCRATLAVNTDPVSVRNALYDIGFKSVHMNVSSPSLLNGIGKVSNPERNYYEMLRMIESDSEAMLRNIFRRDTEKLRNKYNQLKNLLVNFIYSVRKHHPCGAGRTFAGVSVSGDVYLCHRFVGMEEYKIGTVFDTELKRDIVEESPLKTVPKCSNCSSKYLCGGGCYHDNLGTTGSIFDPPEDMCRYRRSLVKLVASLSGSLDAADMNYLIDENIIPEKPCPIDWF